MSTYIIGDVQGCFDQLQLLLKKIAFNRDEDTLIFVGDLVNRGPKSLETLLFIYQLPKKIVLLGNHDLYFINLAYRALPIDYKPHTLEVILNSSHADELAEWLRHQPLLYRHKAKKYTVVHAGIPPQWSIDMAEKYAEEVSNTLRSENFFSFLKNMFGDEPSCWNENLQGDDRLRYITNALTRLRFCDAKGCLNNEEKGSTIEDNRFHPWFNWPRQYPLRSEKIYFGHWAALEGKCSTKNCYALDTGCVWGGPLTAICVETQRRLTVTDNR